MLIVVFNIYLQINILFMYQISRLRLRLRSG